MDTRREPRRIRQRISLVLSDEAREALDALAGPGGSLSAVVDRLILIAAYSTRRSSLSARAIRRALSFLASPHDPDA
jgi:hypothetical protein